MIQIVKITQHTLFDFYLYVNSAAAGNFSGIAAIRGHFFAIYQFLVYAATNNFKESLLEKAAFIPLTNPCFAECRMIWYPLSGLETAKPAIRNVSLDFLGKPTL